jgi:hypothetical protein
VDLARQAVAELLQILEDGTGGIDRALFKAQRVARLLRDADAQLWLDKELRGYPPDFPSMSLGACAKYAARWYTNGAMLTTSLPELEAQVRATETVLALVRPPTFSTHAENYIVAGATKDVLDHVTTDVNARIEQHRSAVRMFNGLKTSLHQYAADTFVALELGDYAEGIFEAARADVDRFVSEKCPRAADQLVAAGEQMRDGGSEARSAALTACRRLLLSVADTVFPGRDEPHVGRDGKKRGVGADQYKNRLLAFIETRLVDAGSLDTVEAQLGRTASLVDAVYESACKGVHANVSAAEARIIVIQTYLLVAEVARLAGGGGAVAERSPPSLEPADASGA